MNRINRIDLIFRLSLSCNQLTSICSLPHLDKLSFLGLFGNSLHNSEEIETVLKIQCPNLETLFVSGNPFVTKVSHYRKILVFSLPKLKWLDWIYVSPQERNKIL
jgi:Leucine-rich repeat (LRR) protein